MRAVKNCFVLMVIALCIGCAGVGNMAGQATLGMAVMPIKSGTWPIFIVPIVEMWYLGELGPGIGKFKFQEGLGYKEVLRITGRPDHVVCIHPGMFAYIYQRRGKVHKKILIFKYGSLLDWNFTRRDIGPDMSLGERQDFLEELIVKFDCVRRHVGRKS